MPLLIILSPSVLTLHPQNPRPRLTEAEVAELRASIEAHGQKQPCVVRPIGENGSKQYQVVIGHRRVFVAKLLGRDVPCLVEDLDDDEALALMLSDNRVRTDPDPFMESKAVDALLRKEGHTLQSVADLLGKSPRWISARANLKTLTPKSRKILEKAGWTVARLEDWARVSPEVQDAEVERVAWVKDPRQLQGIVSRYLRVLGRAPWALDDATLLPKAGPCSACPKQSMACPGLFSDGEEKDVKKATCRDSLCWKAKADAHAAKTLADLRKDNPDLVLVAADVDAKHLPALKNETVLDPWTVEPSKKGAKGALPAAKVSADGRVTRIWIQPPKASHGSGNGRKPKKTGAEMSPKERLEVSKARYAIHLFQRTPWREKEVISASDLATADFDPHDPVLYYIDKDEIYRVIDGWRRLQLARAKGVKEIEAKCEGRITDQRALELVIKTGITQKSRDQVRDAAHRLAGNVAENPRD